MDYVIGSFVVSAEPPPRTFCTFLRELPSRRTDAPHLLEELSGLSERPMIIHMTIASVRSNAMTIGSGILSNAPGT
jgi:hypothetical protein